VNDTIKNKTLGYNSLNRSGDESKTSISMHQMGQKLSSRQLIKQSISERMNQRITIIVPIKLKQNLSTMNKDDRIIQKLESYSFSKMPINNMYYNGDSFSEMNTPKKM
jgi:hypothetical protein